jgi:hypothetical protein
MVQKVYNKETRQLLSVNGTSIALVANSKNSRGNIDFCIYCKKSRYIDKYEKKYPYLKKDFEKKKANKKYYC